VSSTISAKDAVGRLHVLFNEIGKLGGIGIDQAVRVDAIPSLIMMLSGRPAIDG